MVTQEALGGARVFPDFERTCEESVSDLPVCNATGWIAAGNNCIVRLHRSGILVLVVADRSSFLHTGLEPS